MLATIAYVLIIILLVVLLIVQRNRARRCREMPLRAIAAEVGLSSRLPSGHPPMRRRSGPDDGAAGSTAGGCRARGS